MNTLMFKMNQRGISMRNRTTEKQYMVRFLVERPNKRTVTRRVSVAAPNLVVARTKLETELATKYPDAERIVTYEF